MSRPQSPPALRVLLTVSTVLGAEDSLEAINTQLVMDRGLVSVVENNALYMLRREATDAPSGSTIVEPAAGPGRWFKYPVASGGSSFDPIQNVRFLDSAFPGTPNGSIAEPFTTLAAFNAEVLSALPSSWELMLPAAVVTVDENIPDLVGTPTTIVYQGVSSRATELSAFNVENQTSFPTLVFRDLTLDQLTFDGGFSAIEAYDSSVNFAAAGTLTGSVKLFNCLLNADCHLGGRTLLMVGGNTGGNNLFFSTGRFEDVSIDAGATLTPGAGTTSFIACKFGAGISISNANTPTIELDPYSNYWFVLNGVTYGGTIVLTPAIGGGGSSEPIRNIFYLDPSSVASSPNGSIAAPFVDWADTITAIQAVGSGYFEVMLPTGSVNLTATGTLSGISALVFAGAGNNASFCGTLNMGADYTGLGSLNFKDLQLDILGFTVDFGSQHANLDGVSLGTLNILAGNNFIFTARDSQFSGINCGSVTSALKLTNCTLSDINSAGPNVFGGCTVIGGATWALGDTWSVRGTQFGAGVVMTGNNIAMDQESEYSFLSGGGNISVSQSIVSLSGQGTASSLPNANAPDLDFTGNTRAVLCATRPTGNIVKQIALTGGAAMQTFTIDSYNTSGFTYTIQFAAGTLAVIGNGNFRYVFQINAAASAVVLLSKTKL